MSGLAYHVPMANASFLKMKEAAAFARDNGRGPVAAAARTQAGVKFHHQGRIAGAELDCVGLIVLSFVASGFETMDRTDYSRHPQGTMLVEAIASHCDEVEPGEQVADDVLCFKAIQSQDVQHIGIWTDRRTIIHSRLELNKVAEHRLDDYWERLLTSVWRRRRD